MISSAVVVSSGVWAESVEVKKQLAKENKMVFSGYINIDV